MQWFGAVKRKRVMGYGTSGLKFCAVPTNSPNSCALFCTGIKPVWFFQRNSHPSTIAKVGWVL